MPAKIIQLATYRARRERNQQPQTHAQPAPVQSTSCQCRSCDGCLRPLGSGSGTDWSGNAICEHCAAIDCLADELSSLASEHAARAWPQPRPVLIESRDR